VTTASNISDIAQVPEFPPERSASCPFDPPPEFAEWRAMDGLRKVKWNGIEVWAVSRYEDIKFALTDPRISADTLGKLQPGFPGEGDSTIPIFPRMDDPEHNRIRRLLTKDFTVKRVQAMRPRIEEMVDTFLSAMISKGPPADIVRDYALPVPSLVVSLLLGVPYEDHEFFQHHSQISISMEATAEERGNANIAMFGYLYELIGRQEEEQGEGLLGRVFHEHVVSGELSREALAANGVLILGAGHETTANMIALSTLYLMQNPDQLALIRDNDDPALTSKAVEELLRYLTVVTSLVERIAVEDVEIGGQLVRAGEGLIMNLPAGNRDCAYLADADTFDVNRNNMGHLAFGHGTHQCIGQMVARAELEIALPPLFRRIPELRLAVPLEDLRLRNDMGVFGIHALPVTW
jgi:cytochrome P450